MKTNKLFIICAIVLTVLTSPNSIALGDLEPPEPTDKVGNNEPPKPTADLAARSTKYFLMAKSWIYFLSTLTEPNNSEAYCNEDKECNEQRPIMLLD